MPRTSPKNSTVNRIIDANLNRVKEGLRVCEEVSRFILDSRVFTAAFKGMRHRIGSLVRRLGPYPGMIKERDASGDIGRRIYKGELSRRDYQDIFFANIQRVKESLRVLEEFSKLTSTRTACAFKDLRYEAYQVEKRIIEKFAALRRHR